MRKNLSFLLNLDNISMRSDNFSSYLSFTTFIKACSLHPTVPWTVLSHAEVALTSFSFLPIRLGRRFTWAHRNSAGQLGPGTRPGWPADGRQLSRTEADCKRAPVPGNAELQEHHRAASMEQRITRRKRPSDRQHGYSNITTTLADDRGRPSHGGTDACPPKRGLEDFISPCGLGHGLYLDPYPHLVYRESGPRLEAIRYVVVCCQGSSCAARPRHGMTRACHVAEGFCSQAVNHVHAGGVPGG